MVIRSMQAVFGRLEGDRLELGEGLNIITAPNESGKSTWCAFIRAMLYGIDSSEREKAGFKPDKVKYAPWSGAAMSGRMELRAGDRDLTLTRGTRTASAPMREFRASYTGTGEPVPGLTGADCGEKLTGASKRVFTSSAFIAQAGLAVGESPDLEKRISSIVSSGDESDSWAEADERLRAWQRRRRHNRYGLLPELEEEMDLRRQRLREMESAARERAGIEARLAAEQTECSQLQAAVEEARKSQRRSALERLSDGKAELRAAESDFNERLRDREEAAARLEEGPFGLREPEKVAAELEPQLETCRRLERQAASRPPVLLLVLPLLALVIFAALGALMSPYWLAGAVPAAALSAWVILRWRRAGRAAGQLRETLALCGADSPGQLERDMQAHRRDYAAWQEACAAAERAGQALEEERRRQQGLDHRLLGELDFDNGDTEAARMGRLLAMKQSRLRADRERRSELDGQLLAMGDPVVTDSALREMEARRAELTAQYEALALAVEQLREANTEIQTRFSPALGKLAAEYMGAMTRGGYSEVKLDRKFALRVREPSSAVDRESAYLSAGAEDQLYLALRLAISRLALPEEKACPVILDDALASFDDERCRRALELLLELSGDRQIILFSCHSREAEYLADRPGVRIQRLK